VAAYEAPFPDERYKAGARVFPSLVPIQPDDPASAPNRRAWEGLMRYERPFLTVFGDSDPITRGADRFLQAAIPGARDRKHATIAQAGHFLQEDDSQALAVALLDFLRG
jgi:haloalkane dehalogenase